MEKLKNTFRFLYFIVGLLFFISVSYEYFFLGKDMSNYTLLALIVMLGEIYTINNNKNCNK
jgi:small basic protein